MNNNNFIKIRNKSLNLFKILHYESAKTVDNDFSRARDEYKDLLKGIGQEGKQTYNIRYYKVKPHFMGYQVLDEEMVLQISESVWQTIRGLRQLLRDENLPEPFNILLWKKSRLRIDVALTYDHEIEYLLPKMRRQESLDVEMYGNGYVLNNKKYFAIIDNYRIRAEPIFKYLNKEIDKYGNKKITITNIMRNKVKEELRGIKNE